jgi:hypothetical protein
LDEKIRQSAALFWFGLRDVGIFQIFYTHEPSSKEQLMTLPHFGTRFDRKSYDLSPYNPSDEDVGGLDGFLYETA